MTEWILVLALWTTAEDARVEVIRGFQSKAACEAAQVRITGLKPPEVSLIAACRALVQA